MPTELPGSIIQLSVYLLSVFYVTRMIQAQYKLHHEKAYAGINPIYGWERNQRTERTLAQQQAANRYIFHHYILMVVREPPGGFAWEALSAEQMKAEVQHGQPVSQSEGLSISQQTWVSTNSNSA